ncbi:ABC transporter substrate-binding protein [Neobacillus niacini]|uniref:ABC transporter substrate-binding protein n=1 Tax=Neobacillus niacini TaxID=86668 RepID=UPI0030026034
MFKKVYYKKKRSMASRMAGWISILLVLLLLVSACSAESSTENGEKGDSKPYEVVMTYPAYGDVSDFGSVQEAISKITLEKMNATVKLLPIPVSNYANQVNLMLSGSEKVDLVYTRVWEAFDNKARTGQLLPLNELIGKHGQSVKDLIPPEFADAGKIDGETYGIPSIKGWALTPSLIMSKDLVEKHGIDVNEINTWDDVAPVLELIKTNEPGVAPLVNRALREPPASIIHFLDPLGDFLGVLEFEAGGYKIENKFETNSYKEAVDITRGWFEAGYMNKDITTTQELGSTLVKSGKAFSFLRNINDCASEQISGTELVCAPLGKSYITRNSVSSNMISIGRNSENPEKAMEFINLLYSDEEVINLFTNGIEGKHYVQGKNGLIKKPEGAKSTGYDSNQFLVGNNFLSYVWEGNDPEVWKDMKKMNEEAEPSRAMGFSFDSSQVKNQLTAVTNVVNQFFIAFETGSLDPGELPEFIEKLKGAGIDQIVKEKQKQLDEWVKKYQ